MSEDHEHFFSAIPQRFGQYGPQHVHYHTCIEGEGCERILIGNGPDCEAKQKHTQMHSDDVMNMLPASWRLLFGAG